MNHPIATLLAIALGLFPSLAFAAPRTLTAFDGEDSLRWQTVNDGVMGGRSRGDSARTSKGTLRFAGQISLENNGGFSSIRTRSRDLMLGGYDGMEFQVRGDGRTYKFSLRTRNTSKWIAYWADFETKSGEWTTVRIPFTKWVPTTFGRKLPGPRLDPAAINSLGFMLYDKQAGPFALEVASIAAYKGDSNRSTDVKREMATIVDVARSAGTFKTLLAAAKAAGLVEALSGSGPLTLFAPSDAAFARLPEGSVERLLDSENRAELKRLLLHHVIEGRVSASTAGKASTLAGTTLTLGSSNGLEVSGKRIVMPDVPARNGLIHVLDAVLLPPPPAAAAKIGERGSPENAVRVIKSAIDVGVDLYNNGDAEGCVAVYELAVAALLGMDRTLFSERVRERLTASLDSDESAREKAWTLRRALDAAYGPIRAGLDRPSPEAKATDERRSGDRK